VVDHLNFAIRWSDRELTFALVKYNLPREYPIEEFAMLTITLDVNVTLQWNLVEDEKLETELGITPWFDLRVQSRNT